MIHLDYDTTKVVTFYLQPSLSTPVYLLSLVNKTNRTRKSFIVPESSGVSNMLQFTITEVGTGSENLLTGDIGINEFGRYTLEVYEQVSVNNLDVSAATFIGDDEIIIHKEPTYNNPPESDPLEEESICPLSVLMSSSPETGVDLDNGTATATAVNDSGTVTYLWNDPLEQTTQTAINLVPGVYMVIISDDVVGGCTASGSVEVAEAGITPICNLTIDSFTITGTTPALNDGMATVHYSGNAGTVNFRWGNGQETQTATGLAVGELCVSISDSGVGGSCMVLDDTVIPNLFDPSFVTNTMLVYNTANDNASFNSGGISDLGEVTLWGHQPDATEDFTQTGANKPIYHSSGFGTNNLPYVDFNGAAWLNSTYSQAQAVTTIMILEKNSNANVDGLFANASGTGFQIYTDGSNLRTYSGTVLADSFINNNPVMIKVVSDGVNSKVGINNYPFVIGNSGTGLMTNPRIGRLISGSQIGDFKLFAINQWVGVAPDSELESVFNFYHNLVGLC